MKNRFPNIKHIKSPNSETAVVNGAILYAINPDFIYIRKAKYTYGIGCNNIWDEKKYGQKGIKYYDEISKKYRCKDCFSVFFKINEDIRINSEKVHNFNIPNGRNCNASIYQTTKKIPYLPMKIILKK